MTKDVPHHLTEDEIKAIAERRAEALKRVQELHRHGGHDFPGKDGAKGGKGGKQPPPKGRNFRHQGR